MAAKYTLVVDAAGKPLLCPVTTAQFADMPVKVGKLIVTARKRFFTTVEQIGALTDDDVLKMVNYAEDLFCRAKATAANTPKGEKEAHRSEALSHWAKADIAAGTKTLVEYLTTGPTDVERKAKLDRYWEENLRPTETDEIVPQ